MKARIALLLVGVLPLPLGFIINRLMTTVWLYTFPTGWFWFISLAVLLVWFLAGMVSAKWIESKAEALLFLNAFAIVMLIMLLLPTVLFGRLWSGWAGLSAQYYFLPVIFLFGRLMRFLPRFILIRASSSFIVSFGLMLLASFIGRITMERLTEQ